MSLFGNMATSFKGLAAGFSRRGGSKGAESSHAIAGADRRKTRSERDFSARDCTIWNDIRRALEGGGK